MLVNRSAQGIRIFISLPITISSVSRAHRRLRLSSPDTYSAFDSISAIHLSKKFLFLPTGPLVLLDSITMLRPLPGPWNARIARSSL